ncbi:hypothetical protein ACLOJK_018095 [Asimina triloba]
MIACSIKTFYRSKVKKAALIGLRLRQCGLLLFCASATTTAMSRFSERASTFLIIISAFLNGCCSSYADSAHPIVSAAKAKQVSWKPRAFVYEGFLTTEECDHLIDLLPLIGDPAKNEFCSDANAKSELKRSAVADNLSGQSKLSEVRTSSGMFISKGKAEGQRLRLAGQYMRFHAIALIHQNMFFKSSGGTVLHDGDFAIKAVYVILVQDSIVAGIEDKIAAWTFLPKENGEDIQVLRYEHGQKYEPHYDYFTDKVNIARGGHRFATVLMYLTDVAKGGETVFPAAEFVLVPTALFEGSMAFLVTFITPYAFLYSEMDARVSYHEPPRRIATVKDDLSECAKKGIAVKPRRGDALLFFSLHPNATPDESSLHAGCPVIEGEKWSATKWIRVDSFDIPGDVSSGSCTDGHPNCERWAALGECTNNPEYMVGSPELPGACRRSCKVC